MTKTKRKTVRGSAASECTERGFIPMTADEFLDNWTAWAPDGVTVQEANVLTEMLVRILMAFERRGAKTHHRQVLAGTAGGQIDVLYSSPDLRGALDG